MKRLLLLKSLFLLCALIVGTNAWADDYELYSGTITEGDYVIYYNGNALKNTISSSRFENMNVTPSDGKITNPNAAIVWHIAKDGDYWTIYNAAVSRYAGGNTSKNQGALLASVTNYAKWTVTGSSTYEFANKGRAEGGSNTGNKWLRNNGSNGWACYSDATGDALSLYKKVEAAGAATTVTINSTGITNTNKFVSTEAGTLTATVTYGSPAAAVPGAAVTWSSSNTSVATVGESTGVVTLVGEGTTTITASYAGVAETYKSSSADYVLTVTDEDPNAVTLWSEDFSSFNADDVPSGGTYGYVCVKGNSDTKIYTANMAGGTSPELLVNKNGGSFTATIPLENITGNLKLRFKSNAYAVTVSTSTVGISISGDALFNAAGEHTVTFTGVTTSMTSVEIKFAAASSNVRIDDIVLKGSKVVPVTISSISGFATLYTPYAIDFSSLSSELKAYTASVAGSTVTLTEVDDIPANTGVVLKGEVKTHNIPVINSSSTAQGDLTGNTSAATAWNAFDGYDLYMLALNGGKAQFTLVNGGSIAAGKAFLKLTNSGSGARELNVVFADDEATGVADVRCKMADGRNDFYNLNGQKVLNPTKGLYIVNGKKYVIK